MVYGNFHFPEASVNELTIAALTRSQNPGVQGLRRKS
jgi:hypothetical protein